MKLGEIVEVRCYGGMDEDLWAVYAHRTTYILEQWDGRYTCNSVQPGPGAVVCEDLFHIPVGCLQVQGKEGRILKVVHI